MIVHAFWVFVLALVAAAAWRSAVRRTVVREYQRGLLYRNGRFLRTLVAGAHWRNRFTTEIVLTDARRTALTLPGQELLSADDVTFRTSLIVAFSIEDPRKALHEVQDYVDAIYATAQLALRDVVALTPIDDLLAKRAEVGKQVLTRIAGPLATIGIRVESAEVKDIMLPGEMRKVFADVVLARKEGQAALERSRGETAAMRSLANAAQMLERSPALMNLKVLQSLAVAAATPGNTLVLGVGQGIVPVGGRSA